MKKLKYKEFVGTSWAINNKTSVYLLTIVISIFGLMSYNSIPKEQYPEIVIPTIMVSTIYPGTSPSDMENLVTRPLEKNIKGINGVKKVTSSSVQDFSMISVEFNTDVVVAEAKQKVKDAVDKTKKDLPNNLLRDPDVAEVDFSEIPIMYINIAGNVGLDKLKIYADELKDKIETLKEITRVDIVGALDKEVQIDVDMYKMQAANLSFRDIQNAVAYDNVTVSSGAIDMAGMKRNIRVVGEFKDLDVLRNITLRSMTGTVIFLKDIADINFGNKDRESTARFNGKEVITLNIIKKSGQNLLDASDKTKDIIADYKAHKLPANVNVDYTGDMSRFTRNTLTELNNTIIIGFILVVIVLMFFMGITNAMFVGLSVPLSMALAYIVLPQIGFTMNMLVMFSFIFALGIVVDDAIVVVENTHRIFREGKDQNLSIVDAAKMAAGEVFLPILTGTLTTIAPFLPLAFWPGIVGKFMKYLPITIMITLFASLIVAYIINPVFAVDFMKHGDGKRTTNKKIYRNTAIIIGIGIFCHLVSFPGFGNFAILMAFLYLGYQFFGHKTLHKFETQVMPNMQKKYARFLAKFLIGRRPVYLLISVSALLIFSFILTGIAKPRVVFFPDNDPNSVMVYVKMPVGTELRVTDSITKIAETRIYNVIGKDNPNVESVITNIAKGASDNMFDRITVSTHLGKITVNFVEFSKRTPGLRTSKYIDSIREALKGIPGTEIAVEKNRMGPPTGKPVNIEISGDNIDELITTSEHLKKYLDSIDIPGIEELKSDFTVSKPELRVDIDRVRANREGLSAGQIGGDLRTAITGTEVSKFREGEDQYPIQLRYSESTRKDIDQLMNHKITFMDMTMGRVRSIPVSTVATLEYENSYGGINRKNLKRTIVLSSNLKGNATANEVTARVIASLPSFRHLESVDINLTGEREDQAESSKFMMTAMLLSVFLIIIILVSQFNSFSKPLIILSEIIFSVAGVLLGFVMFDLSISIIMTGMGIIALGGIVIRNGILLVEFTDVLIARGMKSREAIVQAAQSRITPIILTATATILGLIPLAVGFNIDFVSLFTHFEPHIHIGGDNTMFFGPLAWAIVFGLSFATLLTLFLVPAMYQIAFGLKLKAKKASHRRKLAKENSSIKED
ncbi:MAG: efflux RND transporter permease subunit [Bacteroidota bacterium]